MLVSAKEILVDAHEKNYAVGAFNTSNLEFTKAIVEIAEELNAPVIIQTSEKAINYAGIYELWAIVTTIANRCRVPVALHLDHAKDFNVVMNALRTGWTSIMFDASKFSYEENLAMTKMIVQIARPMGVQIEAQLGKVEEALTDPDKAFDFVTKTEIDSLSIAIEKKREISNEKLNIDFDIIDKIKQKINIPLVLYGIEGESEGVIKKAIDIGINKISIEEELKLAFKNGIQKSLKEDLENILSQTMNEIKEIVKEKIKIFGSEGRA